MGVVLILLYKNTEMVRRREIVMLYNHHLIINFSSTRSLSSSPWITSEIAESHVKFNNLDVSQVSKEKQKEQTLFPLQRIREPRLAESSVLSERAQIPHASVTAVMTAAREKKQGKIFLELQRRCLFGFGTQNVCFISSLFQVNPSQNIYNLKNIFIIVF